MKTPPFNFVLVIFLVFASIGLYWLDRLGLSAGSAYLWLVVITVLFIAIASIAKLAGAEFWYEIPINKTPERGVLMLFFGLIILNIIFFIPKVFGLSFYSPMVMAPLNTFSLGIGTTSFSALQAVTSDFWTFFITVISASTIEEFSLGFGFVMIGSFLTYAIRKIFKLEFKNTDIFDFIGAMIFSVIFFSALHIFNGTYLTASGSINIGMFAFAGTFRLILNILIYKFGNFGLLFGIGVHAMNNALFLGKTVITQAILSFPGGLILDVIILLLIIFFVISLPNIVKEGRLVIKEFYSFN